VPGARKRFLHVGHVDHPVVGPAVEVEDHPGRVEPFERKLVDRLDRLATAQPSPSRSSSGATPNIAWIVCAPSAWPEKSI
jgi:hypothetical protein